MLQPRASIIVPLLRQADAWLEQAVVSALRQTVPCEVLVVTSPQTSASNLEILARHEQLRILIQEPGTGFAAALNLGIRHASADRVAFLMSDDWLEPDAAEACLAQTADIVSSGRTFYAPDGITRLAELQQEHTLRAYQRLRGAADQANFLGHFLLFRKDALERAGGVDESLGNTPGVDDFDLIWCLLERGASVAIVPRAVYNYRDHEGERLTRDNVTAMEETFRRILNKHPLEQAERERLFDEHRIWFGVSMWTRYQRLSAWRNLPPWAAKLQRIYRRMIPLSTRIAIHQRLPTSCHRADSNSKIT